MMFIVALTICHLGHAAEPIWCKKMLKKLFPVCQRRRASGCDLTLNPRDVDITISMLGEAAMKISGAQATACALTVSW